MSYPESLLSPGETVVSQFHPHWSRILKEMLLVLFATVIAILIAINVSGSSRGWLALGAVALGVLLALRGFFAWLFTEHVLTNERVIYRHGILAKQGKEIPLEVVNDVAFNQSIFERIVGSGDLLIESAGEHGQSQYTDIPNPEQVQTLIYKLREDRTLSLRGTHKMTASPAEQIHLLSQLHDAGKLSDEEFEEQKSKILSA